MAKRSINLKTARALCTVAEYRVVRASLAPKLTEAQVLKKIALIRGLQDKWRQQSIRQRRSAQKTFGKRAVDSSGRSEDKARLFSDVLALLEGRVSEKTAPRRAGTTSSPRKSAARSAKTSARKSVAKPGRKSSEKAAKRPAKKKRGTSAASTTAPRSNRKKSQSTKKAATSARTPPKKKASGRTPARSTIAGGLEPLPMLGLTNTRGFSALAVLPAQRAVKPSARSQRFANAALTSRRLAESGVTRTRGHAQARGRRSQARRDAARSA